MSKESDLYALAVMTYEMLTGRRPFPGPDFLDQKLHKRFEPAARLEPALPRTVDAFFLRALDPEPSRRFPSARDFAKALKSIGETPIRA